MLAIRFNRTGRKNRAHFRIVVQEHTVAPNGRHVEIVGSYNPHTKEGVFKEERIKYWLEKGAQLSDSVHNLLVGKKIIVGKKRPVNTAKKGKKDEKLAEETQKDQSAKEKPKEVAKEEQPVKEKPKKEAEKEIKKEEKKEAPAELAEKTKA